jgi:hypothetical protein
MYIIGFVALRWDKNTLLLSRMAIVDDAICYEEVGTFR